MEFQSSYYAVRRGRQTGVFGNWEECRTHTSGFSGAVYKKFTRASEAHAFVTGGTFSKKKQTGKVNKRDHKPSKRSAQFPKAGVTDDKVVVYTDGACEKNGKRGARAGVGVYFGANNPRNVSEPLAGPRQTNQRAELSAILRTLEILDFTPTKRLAIYTDSQYSIDCLTKWHRGWEFKGWINTKEEPVENQDLIKGALHLIRTKHRGQVEFVKVRGHAGIQGNVRADKLAVKGRDMQRT